jgi:DnaJ-class molecular chaperone
MKNYYDILQVNNFATDREIKKAFRQLAIKYHPDKNKGRKDYEERFKEIASAYEILSDPIKKRAFDFRFSQQNWDSNKQATPRPTTKTDSNRPTSSKNDKEKEEISFKMSLFWIIAIIIFIIYLINNSYSDTRTTTGNTKADKELEKVENSKKPRTGEVDFK